MWRILNNFSRVFRAHIYNPRPSAGVIVEDDQENAERRNSHSNTGGFCPWKWKDYFFDQSYDDKNRNYSTTDCASQHTSETTGRKRDTFEENGLGCSRSYNQYFWRLVHGSLRVFEPVAWAPVVALGTDVDSYKRKTRLLYRVLFALSGSEAKYGLPSGKQRVVSTRLPSELLAIKDAAGSAHDQEVNCAKTETLESVLEEFQEMSREYTAKNKSILGLEALQDGDMKTAEKHLHHACMLGNSSACFNLGLCYETGSGVPRDASKAVYYYKKAAQGGHRMAMYNLGLMCMGLKQEEDRGGSVGIQDENELGLSRQMGLDFLEEAAELGLAEAQTYLGVLHIQEGVKPSAAVSYFKSAADQNDHEAQYFLGLCYEQGLGVETNECVAAQLYSLAARGGHELALFNLAVFHQHGLGGLPKNEVAARELYEKAAEKGMWQAEQLLAEMAASHSSAKSDQYEGSLKNPESVRSLGPSGEQQVLWDSQRTVSAQAKENLTWNTTVSSPLNPSPFPLCFSSLCSAQSEPDLSHFPACDPRQQLDIHNTVLDQYVLPEKVRLCIEVRMSNECLEMEEEQNIDHFVGLQKSSGLSVFVPSSDVEVTSSNGYTPSLHKSHTFSEFSMIGV